MNISELKLKAKELMGKNYGKAVLGAFLLTIITGMSSGGGSAGGAASHGGNYEEYSDVLMAVGIVLVIVILIALAISYVLLFFVSNVVLVGGSRYFTLCHFDIDHVEYNEIFSGFKKKHYMNIVKIMFFKDLYVFLWSLLFVIPGIMKLYEYRMVPYILGENPEIDKETAFRLSSEMMEGEKFNAFVLDLSFIGWNFLSLLTCGILSIFYVNPYVYLTNAGLYLALRPKAFASMNNNAGMYNGGNVNNNAGMYNGGNVNNNAEMNNVDTNRTDSGADTYNNWNNNGSENVNDNNNDNSNM